MRVFTPGNPQHLISRASLRSNHSLWSEHAKSGTGDAVSIRHSPALARVVEATVAAQLVVW
jgi:hypothetical protein